ncbi:MAG: sulfur carrier protein ThiS [Candidatus Protistobacter heckmanni]|nr:sulfur carrier protein ThiS [Candidatus Protistobacter heckmanni]
MQVLINQQAFQLPDAATVAQALAAYGATPPFAVAVNTPFVSRLSYADTQLTDGDRMEVVVPITGG